jgi:hypothetical protein
MGNLVKYYVIEAAVMLKTGFVDTLKGSYYANINPAIDKFNVSLAQRQDYPEYYGENICAYSHR